jgi:hypothetical protein
MMMARHTTGHEREKLPAAVEMARRRRARMTPADVKEPCRLAARGRAQAWLARELARTKDEP